MKRNVSLLLVLAFLVALTGCGGDNSELSSGVEVDNETRISIPTPAEAFQNPKAVETIGNNPQMAVVYECFFALRRAWLNPPNESGPFGGNQIDGCVVGDWNYLASDSNAYHHVVRRITRANASVTPASTNMLADAYALKAGYERTGQCLFFTALILRRALSYDLPVSWASYPANGRSAREAQRGDVVYYNQGPGKRHIGIVVWRNNDGIDIVDANWVGYNKYRIRSGNASSEIIGRHWVSNAEIDARRYRVFSGKGRWY